MFITYENEKIREVCLLLKPNTYNSSFNSIEVKAIRAIIADLKAAPKLTDAPIEYEYIKKDSSITIQRGPFKIYCQIISTISQPRDSDIERLKITDILNINLQADTKKNLTLK